MVVLFDEETLKRKYNNQKVLDISHQISPTHMAVRKALNQVHDESTSRPPSNMAFKELWLYKKKQLYNSRTYVILHWVLLTDLETTHIWDVHSLENAFLRHRGVS